METTITPPVLTQTGDTADAIRTLARAILNDRARSEGREVSDNAGHVASWLDFVVESIGRKVAELNFAVLDFPLVDARERVSLDVIFGSYTPTQITLREMDDTLNELEGIDISELDEDERNLLDDFAMLRENTDRNHGPWLDPDDGVNDYLTEMIPYDLPEWINDGVDWNELYTQVARRWKRVETGFGEYVQAAI